MHHYLIPSSQNMKDDLNFTKMEDDLNFSIMEEGGQSGNQVGQVHPHHSPLATVWLVASEATHALPQLDTAAQNPQASNTSLSLPKSHLRD